MASPPLTRSARPSDAAPAVRLLYLSAADMYDQFAGGHDRALRVLRRAFATTGTNASSDVVTVAELDGRVAGAMAAFPVDENGARARGILRLTLRSIPPWCWPGTMTFWSRNGRAGPVPPPGALYVDALATDPGHRRRGVARALLAQAEALAREASLRRVALDTRLDNAPARELYRRAGFREGAAGGPVGRVPGFISLVKTLD
jgi:ribosomal protein S18 acetylase RimI-like enzyme